MANKKISELPYINVSEISGNTLVPLVTYYSASTGDTVHTYITDLQNYLTSGITASGDFLPLSGGTVSGGTQFTVGLTANTISATTYQNLPSATFSGGTVTGSTNFTNGLTANTISATTYQNLPTDIRVTGATYSNNTFTYTNNTGGTFSTLFNTVTGLTVNGGLTITGNTSAQGLTATTISATTYQNLPSFSGGSGNCITDLYVTNVYGCSPITLQSSLRNNQTTSTGDLSHSEGFGTETAINNAYSAQSVSSGLITLSSTYGDVTGEFSAGDLLLLYDIPFDYNYGSIIKTISASTFNGVETEIQLQDINITTTTAYVGDITFGINNWTGDQTIPGHYSHAEGYATFSMGQFSHAEGSGTYAIGETSHAEGYRSVSIGETSHAEGSTTQSRGTHSHSEGSLTQSIGYASHSEGNNTKSIGGNSHSEGRDTSSIGDHSHSEGISTKSGYKGYQTSTPITSGVFEIDTSYGDLTSIFTTGSFIIFQDNSGEINTGVYTTYLYEVASSTYNGTPATEITLVDTSINTSTPSSPVGIYNSHDPLLADQSMGAYSHSEGTSTQAIGEFSHSEGEETVSLGWGQTVVGRFNDPISTPSAFIVGDGIDDNNRHNLLVAVNSGVTISGTLSATTYLNLPPSNVTGDYLPLSGGTVSGGTIFTSGLTANTLNVTGLTQTKGITSTGGITFKQVTINSSYTATTDDYMIDVTGGTFTVSLPTAVGVQGRLIVVKNNGGGAVTVDPFGSETIDGKSFVILGETNSIQLASNGSEWVALGYNISTVNSSTGVFEFTGLSIASTTTFNVAPVKGWIVDDTTNPLSPQLYYVDYSGGTHTATYVNTSTETWVYLTSGGTISQSNIELTEQQRRQNIFLGKLGHANKTNIINAFSQPDFVLSPLSQLRDMFTPINLINGGVYASPNGANLSFNTSAGYLYGLGINFASSTLNPNTIYVSGNSPTTFQYRTQTGGTTSNVTVIDPTKYDVGGVVTSISGTKATNQRIYLVQNGIFRVQYGQTQYSNLTQAIEGIATEQFNTFSNFTNNGILIGILSVLSTATNLSNTSNARFFFTSKFGETVGAAGGVSTTTLQQAYNNSVNPEITTNSSLGPLSVKNGEGTADNVTNVFEGVNSGGTTTSYVRADGFISGSTISTPSFTANTNGVTTTTVSATTYQNLPTDVRVTGTTYSNNTFTFTNNTGGTFSSLFNTVTGLTINGNLTVTGNTNVRAFTGTTGYISGSGQNILTVIGSGNSTTSPLFTVQGSSGELFSVNDSLVGSLFSVNDISGLPILEVFSDNTTLMGSYQAPSLNTTTRVTLTAGTNTVYSIPTSAYTGAFIDYTLVSTGTTGARAGNIMTIWSGSTAQYTETSTNDIGNTAGVTFSVAVSGNNAVLSSSATTTGWTLKTIVRSI